MQAAAYLPVRNVQLRCVAAGSDGWIESPCHLIREDNRYFQSDCSSYLELQNLKALVSQTSKGAFRPIHYFIILIFLRIMSTNRTQSSRQITADAGIGNENGEFWQISQGLAESLSR